MIRYVAVALIALSAAATAGNTSGHFSGEIQVGGSDPHAFDMVVPIGSTETVFIDGGYTLELTVSSFNKSIASLKDATGKILHKSTSIGPVHQRPTFIYQMCDSGVLFVSPATSELAKCSG